MFRPNGHQRLVDGWMTPDMQGSKMRHRCHGRKSHSRGNPMVHFSLSSCSSGRGGAAIHLPSLGPVCCLSFSSQQMLPVGSVLLHIYQTLVSNVCTCIKLEYQVQAIKNDSFWSKCSVNYICTNMRKKDKVQCLNYS